MRNPKPAAAKERDSAAAGLDLKAGGGDGGNGAAGGQEEGAVALVEVRGGGGAGRGEGLGFQGHIGFRGPRGSGAVHIFTPNEVRGQIGFYSRISEAGSRKLHPTPTCPVDIPKREARR